MNPIYCTLAAKCCTFEVVLHTRITPYGAAYGSVCGGGGGVCVWEVCVCGGVCVLEVVRLVSFMWLFKQKVNRKEKTFMSHDK